MAPGPIVYWNIYTYTQFDTRRKSIPQLVTTQRVGFSTQCRKQRCRTLLPYRCPNTIILWAGTVIFFIGYPLGFCLSVLYAPNWCPLWTNPSAQYWRDIRGLNWVPMMQRGTSLSDGYAWLLWKFQTKVTLRQEIFSQKQQLQTKHIHCYPRSFNMKGHISV